METASSHTVIEQDVEYQRDGDASLLARVYQPQGLGPFAAVVEVHGGAWTSQDRLSNVDIHRSLAQAGILVAALDFRMPPRHPYPASIADVNLGVRWLKANAERFHTRPELVGGLGTSSGGHQVLLNALRPRDARYAALSFPGDGHDASVAFVVACWPVADPLARYRMAQERGMTKMLDSHNAYWGDVDAMEEGNPILLLERGEPAVLPPLLVLQGTKDDNLTPDMAARLADAYSRRGGMAQLEIYEGEPHGFIAKDPESAASTRALATITEFITRQTRGKAGPASY